MAPSISDRLAGIAQQWLPPVRAEHSLPLVMPDTAVSHDGGQSIDRKSWKVLGAIAALAFVAMAWFWFRGQPQHVDSIPVTPTPLFSASGAAGVPSATGEVVVHVAGAVRKPGLKHLPIGSRVADAVSAAGGVTNAKAQDSVNLARTLIDGEQIVVGADGGSASSANGSHSGGKISLNSSNQQQLESLPGVGPSLAQRIMEYRSSHGGFRAVDDLDDVPGIGPATLSRLRPLVSM
ncbi:MAG: helix-hairpin-helix domain-containing protein [Candidatus Nanopelagicales bacterium]|nr:helix-hairpin-helix domain-containing protein [Candidatus Nanopelagicales bacterium]